ncbi:hypothetical protein [Spartinivicinus poritis]|uniref:hypothetical protein n=1 Tax=Spartinivicinus poritis TaxID=2994640 RepID=UPI003CC912C2
MYDFAGTNTFIGGKGDDRIHSGSDRDTIVFRKGDNKDTVTGETTGDVLRLNDINLYDVHFSVEDLDSSRSLHISFKGQASDQITIKNWQENQTLHITTDDGSVIDKQGIDQLIQSLASFDADAWASSSAPVDAQTKAAIASTWTITPG